MTSDIYKDAFI